MSHADFCMDFDSQQEDRLRPMKVVEHVGASSVLQILFFVSEDAELRAICTQLREFQAGNKDLLSCRAGNEKVHLNEFLKLREAKRKSNLFSEQLGKLTQQLMDVRAAQENSLTRRRGKADSVAAKKAAEKQFLNLPGQLDKLKQCTAQSLQERDCEIKDLEGFVVDVKYIAKDVEYDRDEASVRF